MELTRGRLTRVTAAIAGVVALSGAGVAVAAGGATPNPTPPRAPSSAALASLPGSELKYVPVQPCRIFDTRPVGGAVVNNTRTFLASAGNYAGQGGYAGSCGIPANAIALELNVTAAPIGGSSGYVKVWPKFSPEPVASILNFKANPVANMVNTKALPGAGGGLTFRVVGSSHLIGDVAGYYVKPLYAAVDPSGNIYRNLRSGVVTLSRSSVGLYSVTFDRPVNTCGAATNTIVWGTNTDASADVGASANPNTVEVGVTDKTGAFVDDWFTIQIDC